MKITSGGRKGGLFSCRTFKQATTSSVFALFSEAHGKKVLPMAFTILTEELKNVNWQLNGPFLSVNVQRDFITATANTCLYHHEPLVLVSCSQISRGLDVSCIC